MTDITDKDHDHDVASDEAPSFLWRAYDFPNKNMNPTKLHEVFGSAAILPGGIIGGMIANQYASTPLLTEIYNNTGMVLGAVAGFKVGHIAAFAIHKTIRHFTKTN